MARKFSPAGVTAPPGLQHTALVAWVARFATLAQPAQVYWVDGSRAEYDRLCAEMVESGMMRRLNPAKRPNSYLACSDASDVARVEDRTFICSATKQAACAGGLCMSSRSRWARSAVPLPTLASN